MAIPTEADIAGHAAGDIESYLQSAALSGPERVRLFRLAWDASTSAFAGRQNLYEHYFFGDPVRMAGALLKATDREPYKAHVREFLERITEESAKPTAA
jgi:4-hydroxyphenylacetate 3-monooxygenase